MSNKFYCSKGHINAGINGKKPNFCSTCSEKMSIVINSVNKIQPIFTKPLITKEESQEESIYDIPDLNGLSYTIENDNIDLSKDVKKGVTIGQIAAASPGTATTNNFSTNKLSKSESKNQFEKLMKSVVSKTQPKELN